VRLVLTVLSESVAARLREYGLRCSTVQISIRDNRLVSIERQQKMEQATDLARDVVRQAWQLFDRHWNRETPIRSLGCNSWPCSKIRISTAGRRSSSRRSMRSGAGTAISASSAA